MDAKIASSIGHDQATSWSIFCIAAHPMVRVASVHTIVVEAHLPTARYDTIVSPLSFEGIVLSSIHRVMDFVTMEAVLSMRLE